MSSLLENYDTDLSLHHVKFDAGEEDAAGRCPGAYRRRDGTTVPIVLEWISEIPAGLPIALVQLRDELPTDQSTTLRPEEVRTLRIAGVYAKERAALAYELPYVPVTLRDVMLTVDKPTPGDRGVLAKLVTTQVRSLHVHFRNKHMALRTESFVFLRDPRITPSGKSRGAEGLDLKSPYILDWGRDSCPNVYQHPEFDAERKMWYYDIWSLMIILSEIAEWKPMDTTPAKDDEELLRRKTERCKKVSSVEWKGVQTAAVFKFGFEFLEGRGKELEGISWSGVKRFFDTLLELLDASG